MRELITLALIVLTFNACDTSSEASPAKNDRDEEKALDTLHLAFDWRPNVLHLGILHAEQQAWFKNAGIHLIWDTPEIDNYTRKPIKRLLAGEVDLAIGPSEHLLAFAADSNGVKAQAIATLLQSDRSAFVVKSKLGIERPAEIDSALYLGYHTPLENEILSAMIENDGGEVRYREHEPGRLSVWPAFVRDCGAIAWVFLHWEAIHAQRASIALNAFVPNDYGVPYGYSSVIMAPTGLDSIKRDLQQRFLEVLGRAYRELAKSPADFAFQHPNFQDSSFIQQAYEDIRAHYLDGDSVWGRMNSDKWRDYAAWLEDRNLLDLKGQPIEDFYTNQYLP